MSGTNTGKKTTAWIIAILCGLAAFVVLKYLIGYAMGASAVIGILVALLVAITLWIGWFGEDDDADNKSKKSKGAAAAAGGAAAVAATAAAAKKPAAKKAAAKKPAAKKTAAKKSAAKATTTKAKTTKASAAKPAAAKKPAASKSNSKAGATKPAAIKRAPAAADGNIDDLVLKKARGGKADNLKALKGVGPKIETQLHTIGLFHFDQVATLRKKEVTWLDDKLVGSSAAQINDWVAHSKRVAKGKVY